MVFIPIGCCIFYLLFLTISQLSFFSSNFFFSCFLFNNVPLVSKIYFCSRFSLQFSLFFLNCVNPLHFLCTKISDVFLLFIEIWSNTVLTSPSKNNKYKFSSSKTIRASAISYISVAQWSKCHTNSASF